MSEESEIGKRIKERQAVLGMSTRELSRRLKLADTTIHNWVKHGASPMAENIVPLAKVLSCDLNWLLLGKSGGANNTQQDKPEQPRVQLPVVGGMKVVSVDPHLLPGIPAAKAAVYYATAANEPLVIDGSMCLLERIKPQDIVDGKMHVITSSAHKRGVMGLCGRAPDGIISIAPGAPWAATITIDEASAVYRTRTVVTSY